MFFFFLQKSNDKSSMRKKEEKGKGCSSNISVSLTNANNGLFSTCNDAVCVDSDDVTTEGDKKNVQ